MKRFYKKVSVASEGDGFIALLDGKKIKTPAKSACIMPTERMARAVAKEWDDQEEEILPASMPITKLVNTAIDRVESRRDELLDELVKYAGSDQVCYRAEHPMELIDLQKQVWDPLLEWVNEELSITFKVADGIIFVEQDEDDLKKIRSAFNALDSYKLTALHGMITVTGSVTIGYALYCNHITLEEAWNAGHLDENFQISQWGSDEEAEERRKNLRQELKNSLYLLRLSYDN